MANRRICWWWSSGPFFEKRALVLLAFQSFKGTAGRLAFALGGVWFRLVDGCTWGCAWRVVRSGGYGCTYTYTRQAYHFFLSTRDLTFMYVHTFDASPPPTTGAGVGRDDGRHPHRGGRGHAQGRHHPPERTPGRYTHMPLSSSFPQPSLPTNRPPNHFAPPKNESTNP